MRVPVQRQQEVRESGEPLAYHRTPNAGNVAEIGQALQGLGGNIHQASNIGLKYLEQKRHEEDQASAMDVYGKMSKWKIDALNGEGGIYTSEGSNAIGSTDRYAALYKKQYAEFTKDLSEGALSYANKLTERDHLNTLGQISRFEAGQIKAYKDASSQAMIAGAVDNAISYANDPDAMQNSFAEIKTAIDTLYAGKPKDFRDLKMLEATTNVHNVVLDKMIDENPDMAKEYLEDHSDEISSNSIVVNQKKLEKATGLQKSQKIADDIDYNKLSQSEALDLVRENHDGDERRIAIQLIKTRYAEKRQAEDEDYKQAYDDVLSVINEGGTVTSSQWAALSERDENTLLKYKYNLTEGKTIKTNPKTWKSLYEMSVNNPDGFKDINLNLYINSLSTGDFKEFVKAQSDARKGQVDFALTSLMGPATEAKNYLKNASIKPDSDDGLLFMRQAQRMVSDLESEQGRKSTPEERTKIFDHLMLNVEINDGTFLGVDWHSPNKKLFQVAPDEVIEPLSFNEIPSAEKELITEALVRRGFEVTPEAIVEMYGVKLNAR